MRILKYPLLLFAVFIVGVLIMGGNNAYEYSDKFLLLAPSDTSWKYLSKPLFWPRWNKNISDIQVSENGKFHVVFKNPNEEIATLHMLQQNRDSLSIKYVMNHSGFTKTVHWTIKPDHSLCSLLVVEKTKGNSFFSNAYYAFDMEDYEEATRDAYDSLRLIIQ